MEVYDLANNLAKQLKNSKEYNEYKEIKEKVKLNEELNKKIEEFNKARYNLQLIAIQGEKQNQDKIIELQNLYAELVKDEDIKNYFELEIKFNTLLSDVNRIIGEAVKDVLS